MFSSDVVSRFTNVPITKSLIVIKDRLKKDETLKNKMTLSVEDICDLLKLCLDSTYVIYNGQFYRLMAQL